MARISKKSRKSTSKNSRSTSKGSCKSTSKNSRKSNRFGRQPSIGSSYEDSERIIPHNLRDIEVTSSKSNMSSLSNYSSKRKHYRPDIELPSRTSIKSSLSSYGSGSIITETDPGEHYEKWKARDKYDSGETYLSSVGSKYTSRKKKNNNKK